MELLTRNNFESWMQKLMERLDRQDELLLAMKAEERQPALTESIRLFDNQDLCMLLQISTVSYTHLTLPTICSV